MDIYWYSIYVYTYLLQSCNVTDPGRLLLGYPNPTFRIRILPYIRNFVPTFPQQDIYGHKIKYTQS
jgi:hypothetical protein